MIKRATPYAALVAVFYCIVFSSDPSYGKGLFDFLDPCIAAKNDYWAARNNIMSDIEKQKSAVKSQKAPVEFRDFWWKEKRKLLQDYFDANLGDVIRAGGGNYKKAFEIWLAKQVEAQGGMKAIDPIIESEFKKTKTLLLDRQKGATQAKLDETKQKLYDGCPQDVGNQVFRGGVVILTAPVNIVRGNFDAAGRESGDIAKVLRAITGVSESDIRRRGVCGGDNSEMRKLFGSLC